ncbi:MAG: Clp protease N-terminal domain-containing protein [Hyphomicrobiaceae bacterium]
MAQSMQEALSRVAMSRTLGETFQRAHAYAREQAHRKVALEHLLLALCEDQDAGLVMQACQIDIQRLATDASSFIGRIEDRLQPGEVGEPAADPDLLRILEYAAAAAHQSRRRDINGAIVLAAIVGEGRSAAAQMLRSQGLTFEETIKALQRATAATRQPPARPPAELAPPQPQPQPSAPQPRLDPDRIAPPRPVTGGPPPNAEEILASVRERINTGRTQPPQPKPAPQLPPPQPAIADPTFGAAPAPLPEAKRGPPELTPYRPESIAVPPPLPAPAPAPAPELRAPPQAHRPPPPPQPQRAQYPMPPPAPTHDPQGGQGWAPQPSAQSPDPRRTQPRPVALPPLAPPPPPDGRQARRFPEHQAPAPWPETGREAPQAPPQRGGAVEEARQAPPPGAPAPRSASQVPVPVGRGVDLGQLIENVPRFMRVGVPEIVEVRIARADLQNVAIGLEGRGTPVRHDLVVTRAMSVKLRAPEGGMWIETASPETQWIESRPGLMSDDFASWRWTVLPERRGRARLQLVAAARTVGADGLAAETALPDQIIEVRVGVNYGRLASRWGGWAVAAILGGVLAKFGEDAFKLGMTLVGG